MKKEINKTLKMNRTILLFFLFLGITLMIYMIKVENELGALPLLLVISSIILLAMNQYQIRKHLQNQ